MNTEEKEMTIAKWHEKGKKTGKKYELVEDDCIEYDGHKLYRIRALNYVLVPGFINEHIYPGALGGYVASEKNLVQTGNCWVCDGAKVYGNAIVKDNAVVGKDAVISENAVILENAYVIEKSVVEGNCIVKGHAGVSQFTVVCCISSIFLDKAISFLTSISGQHLAKLCLKFHASTSMPFIKICRVLE